MSGWGIITQVTKNSNAPWVGLDGLQGGYSFMNSIFQQHYNHSYCTHVYSSTWVTLLVNERSVQSSALDPAINQVSTCCLKLLFWREFCCRNSVLGSLMFECSSKSFGIVILFLKYRLTPNWSIVAILPGDSHTEEYCCIV